MNFAYSREQVTNTFLALLLVLALGLLIYLIKPLLGALGIAVVLTYFLNPIVGSIQRLVRYRGVAVLVTSLFILLPLFILSIFLTTSLVAQLFEFLKTPQAKEAMGLIGENIWKYVAPPPSGAIGELSLSTLSAYREVFTQGLGTFYSFFKSLGGFFMQAVLGLVFTAYALLKGEDISTFFSSIKDRKFREYVLFVDEGLKQVVYSMFFTALVTGLISLALYETFKVPFSLLLAFTTGVVALAPVLGTWLIYLPVAIYLYYNVGAHSALIFFGLSFLFISTIPDAVVRPLVASKRVDVGLLLLGFISGALVFGPVGVLVGPLIIIAVVGFIRVYLEGVGSPT